MACWCVTWTSTPTVSTTWPAVETTARSSSGMSAMSRNLSRHWRSTHTGGWIGQGVPERVREGVGSGNRCCPWTRGSELKSLCPQASVVLKHLWVLHWMRICSHSDRSAASEALTLWSVWVFVHIFHWEILYEQPWREFCFSLLKFWNTLYVLWYRDTPTYCH